MSTTDPNRARSRFLSALRRNRSGIELQRARILEHARTAPRLLSGTPYEAIDLTDAPDNDLDYYVYELGRLRAIARTLCTVFDRPAEVVSALEAFDKAIPHLSDARNPLTHPSDDARLDDAAWMSAFIKLRPDGSVQYLVDPRYEHHDAAIGLSESLSAYLRTAMFPEHDLPE